MRNIIFISLFITLVTLPVQGASVWKVSKGDTHLYIGGTIHILSENDYPLPEAYELAYKGADTLVFETDIVKMSDPAFQQQFKDLMIIEGGKTIRDILTDKTIRKLEQHLTTRGIPLQALAGLKPGFLSVTLSVIELQVMGIKSAGVDQYYATKAQADNKAISWFESPKEQLDMIAQMGSGNEDNLINYSIDDIDQMRTVIPKLMSAWRTGDMTALANQGLLEMKAEFPNVYNSLILQRNKNWIPSIESLFTDDSQEFILVGAMHLAGPDSVLTMLEKKGYKITEM